MCVEISNTMAFPAKNTTTKKVSYTIKKLLKHLFKQSSKVEQQNIENTKKAESLESLESLENLRNADIESECSSLESFENEANERLSAAATVSMCDFEFADIHTVPVHFVRTEHGTFFWTATADIPADNDLVEPLYCATANQVAISQFHDRWAQA